jgi:PAS domain S-box-containing protein
VICPSSEGNCHCYQGNISKVEKLAKRADGSLAPIIKTINKIVFEERECYLESFIDISKQKSLEDNYHDLFSRFKIATDSAQIGVWDLDLKNNTMICNDLMRKIYAKTPEDKFETLKDWEKCVHKEDIERVQKIVLEAIRLDTKYKSEFRIIWPDGQIRNIKAFAHIHKNSSGEAVRMTGVNYDITSQKQIEEQLRKALNESKDLNAKLSEAAEHAQKMAEKAEKANQAKKDFLANISHEIRTPLNGIMGMNTLLLETELSSIQRDYAEMAKDSSKILLTLINDLLDISKIENGKLSFDIQEFSPRSLIEKIIKSFAYDLRSKKLDFFYFIDPEVPEILKGDPTRLRQILSNLINNAIKFTDDGEIILRIKKEDETKKEISLFFSISDTGIGIPKEKQDMLFEKFTQADASRTRRHGGAGLGLAISKQLTLMMGGEIGVRNRTPKGAEFWFTSSHLKSSAKPKKANKKAPLKMRTMSVSDNVMWLDFLSSNLQEQQIETLEAQDANDAIEKLYSEPPIDAVIIDLDMQAEQGESLVSKLKSSPKLRKIPMAGITNKSIDPERDDIAHIWKPIIIKDLVSTLKESQKKYKRKISESFTIPNSKPIPGKENTRILVAEDNAVNQKLTIEILKRFGIKADCVSNGIEAIDALTNFEYDIVLMDIQMPQLDGWEATKAIRNGKAGPRNRKAKIIAMTAHAMHGDHEKCLEAGMDDYLPKPVDAKKLREKLNIWLDLSPEKKQSDSPKESHEEASFGKDKEWDMEALLDNIGGNKEALIEVVNIFLEDAPKQISAIENAIDENNFDGLAMTAHSLKGAARNFTADRLADCARLIEIAGRKKEQEKVPEYLSELQKEFYKIKKITGDIK